MRSHGGTSRCIWFETFAFVGRKGVSKDSARLAEFYSHAQHC